LEKFILGKLIYLIDINIKPIQNINKYKYIIRKLTISLFIQQTSNFVNIIIIFYESIDRAKNDKANIPKAITPIVLFVAACFAKGNNSILPLTPR